MAGTIEFQRDRVFVAFVIIIKFLNINLSFDCRYIGVPLNIFGIRTTGLHFWNMTLVKRRGGFFMLSFSYDKIWMLRICGLQPCCRF